MNSKVEVEGSGLDILKLTVAIGLLLSAVVAFYYYAESSLLYRVLGLLGVALVALGIASQTGVGRRVLGTITDARAEVRKVVWPTRAETVQTTLLVVVMVVILGIIVWLIDMFLGWGIRTLAAIGS